MYLCVCVCVYVWGEAGEKENLSMEVGFCLLFFYTLNFLSYENLNHISKQGKIAPNTQKQR